MCCSLAARTQRRRDAKVDSRVSCGSHRTRAGSYPGLRHNFRASTIHSFEQSQDAESAKGGLATLSIESSDSFVAYTIVSMATGWSEPVPGRELHPLKSAPFTGALFRQLNSKLLRVPMYHVGTDHVPD
jgi:hypothetical protein